MAALLTCASLAAWGQEPENPDEETTEETAVYKVYTNEPEGVEITVPQSEIEAGGTLIFTVTGEGVKDVIVFQDGEGIYAGKDDGVNEGEHTVEDIQGDILIVATADKFITVDGVTYRSNGDFDMQYWSAEQPASSSVELKNVLETEDGVYYEVTTYLGCYAEYDNVTSITFPYGPMFFWGGNSDGIGCIGQQKGLEEIHVKSPDPSKYDVETAFDGLDFSAVTLYVPLAVISGITKSKLSTVRFEGVEFAASIADAKI